MCEPWPRTIYSGSQPTARKARTGEFTPPGINCSARLCSLRDCSVLRAIIPPQQGYLSPGAPGAFPEHFDQYSSAGHNGRLEVRGQIAELKTYGERYRHCEGLTSAIWPLTSDFLCRLTKCGNSRRGDQVRLSARTACPSSWLAGFLPCVRRPRSARST